MSDPSPADAALDFLVRRINYERTPATSYRTADFKLDRMRSLLSALGDPQQAYPIVHVAGTKGKGSTAAMIAASLRAAGYRTGIYSSPHLSRVEERFVVDGRMCSSDEFVDLVNCIRPVVEAFDARAAEGVPGPTYFEVTTALAMLHFARSQVDCAVLEVGLGGRLDSTNVCQPEVAVITSISYDHTQQLGKTLTEIAGEKGGIIKPGVPVVSGVLAPEAQVVVRCLAQERGCRFVQLDEHFAVQYRPPHDVDAVDQLGRIDYREMGPSSAGELLDVPVRLLGQHQACNAAVALATLGELRRAGWQISTQAMRDGLATAVCPARVEVICRQPTVVLDAAHNTASIEALVSTLESSFRPGRRLLVFATSQDKDARGMLEHLLPSFDQVIFTRYTSNPRALPPEKLEALAAELDPRPRIVCHDPASAWAEIRRTVRADDLVCITGSFFTAAEMRDEIRRQPLAQPRDMAVESA